MSFCFAPLMSIAAVSVMLAGCFGDPSGSPSPVATTTDYAGSDASTLTVIGMDLGCCYIEGSLHFARLDGPTRREWQMDQPLPLPSTGLDGPREVGSEMFQIQPGEYTAMFWQRPCDANCGNLDPPASQCITAFSAQPDVFIRIDVTFPLERPCTVAVTP